MNVDTEILKLKERLESLTKSMEVLANEKSHWMKSGVIDTVVEIKSNDTKRVRDLENRIKELEELIENQEANASLKDSHIARLTSDLNRSREELLAAQVRHS